ncbi:MAG: hypothetical protein JRN07_02735 [Nitrososphaerota archaeon]|nr:hypothetical protein [Nitrososphaerota archaeon]
METMGMTTITISEKTKSDLLRVAAELQARTGKKVGYEGAIEYLIAKDQRNLELFRKAVAPKGVGSEELQQALREGRAEDKRHDEFLERTHLTRPT